MLFRPEDIKRLWESDPGRIKVAKSSDGTQIAYWIYGDDKNPPLVFVMGLGMDHRGWIAQIPYFSQKFRVIALDNRGVGRSDVPEPPYSTDKMAEDVLAVIKNEKIDSAFFVGASMGGMILQKFASRFPEKVQKLVLACTLTHMTEHEKKLVEKGVEFLKGLKISADEFKSFISTLLDVNPKMLFDFLSKYLFSPKFFENAKDMILTFFESYLKDGFNTKGFLGQLTAVLSHDGTQDIKRIKSPTLVITGSADKMVPPQKSEYIAQNIKGSKLVIIEGGSHAFMMEMPDKFNLEVEKFLLES